MEDIFNQLLKEKKALIGRKLRSIEEFKEQKREHKRSLSKIEKVTLRLRREIVLQFSDTNMRNLTI